MSHQTAEAWARPVPNLYRFGFSARARVIALGAVLVLPAMSLAQPGLVTGTDRAPLRGFYEVRLTADPPLDNGFTDHDLRVTFNRPNGSSVAAGGFYDGGTVFKARAYLDQPGTWTWSSAATNPGLNGAAGSFTVDESRLPGKLRRHHADSNQFAFDDGRWFLHIGDTGYRYVNPVEPHWQAYIDQAADVGFTKIRTWFGNVGEGSNGSISYMLQDGRLNLEQLRTADQRLQYALNRYPHIQFQLIPFGEDDRRLMRYVDADNPEHALVRTFAREVQARYSALPNVHWCLSNDRRLAKNPHLRDAVNQLGQDWHEAEPWGTLITNHQMRREPYSFVHAEWSSIVTFETMDETCGIEILRYRRKGATDPIVNDEDRYESYIPPRHDRYFFRRMMWSSLLSGGAATYGGGRTWTAYQPDTWDGVQGYHDLNAVGMLEGGADDFKHIHQFFKDTRQTLVGLKPSDGLAGDDPQRLKVIRGPDLIIAYLANSSDDRPSLADAADAPSTITFNTGLELEGWFACWFDPRQGTWRRLGAVNRGTRSFTAPGPKDWVLLLSADDPKLQAGRE